MKHVTPEMVAAFKERFHKNPGHETYDRAVAAGIEAALSAAEGAPELYGIKAEPFLYGIQRPNGGAYLDEVCVDDKEDILQDLIDDNDMEDFKVVPLYLQPELSRHRQAISLFNARAERLNKLKDEYRPTMDQDILHSWAVDVVETLKGMQS